MSSEPADAKVVQSVTVEAVVIRADGTREERGVVAEWHADDQLRSDGASHTAARAKVRFSHGEA